MPGPRGGRTVKRLTPDRIRKIRQGLGLSKKELGRVLWAAEITVNRWESGGRVPIGIHYRLLILFEQHLASPVLRAALRDPRGVNPMFFIYRLLELVYGNLRT
jgi:transcriptional regulator with XRE-family HTH domain